MSSNRQLCVFCGSSSGVDPAFKQTAEVLGRTIAEAGHHLVYGGGDVGLMGAVAEAALGAGSLVTGVITEHLMALEVGHQGLTTLKVEPTMHDRKAQMAELADGVIVLPGGFGTLEEAFEILTWNQLGLTASPVVFLDVNGFFDPLFTFIESAVTSGFVTQHHADSVCRTTDPVEAVALASGAGPVYKPKWVD